MASLRLDSVLLSGLGSNSHLLVFVDCQRCPCRKPVVKLFFYPKTMAGTKIDVENVSKFLSLFNDCDGIITIQCILKDFSDVQKEFSEEQLTNIEIFENALMQLHWVLDALDQCELEISQFKPSSMKRKNDDEATEESKEGVGLLSHLDEEKIIFQLFFGKMICAGISDMKRNYYVTNSCVRQTISVILFRSRWISVHERKARKKRE